MNTCLKLILIAITCISMVNAQSQPPLTIDECYALARLNYPLLKQRDLIAKTNEYTLGNLSKGYLPQLNLGGQATYQSDVTQIPIKLPGVKIPTISKDQYKIYGEINQPITDLLTIGRQKKYQEINSQIQTENLEAELYKVKDRINQLFFGILLLDRQNAQNELLKSDLQSGMDKLSAAYKNGIELKSNVEKLKAEWLKANQQSIELKSSRNAYIAMLGIFINKHLDETILLDKPKNIVTASGINRPEMKVFDFQKNSRSIQYNLLNIKNLPRLSLFLQGGFGKPSPVNLLTPDLSSYYIGGIRMNWPLSGYYTFKREKQLISIDMNMIDVQKETFVFNTGLVLSQQNLELEKLRELLKSDDEIVNLRTSIKNTSGVQLANGVITTNDYLKEINAEDQAKQNFLLHEIQLLMAQYNYQYTSGN
jgi:outer membrane protein TolC